MAAGIRRQHPHGRTLAAAAFAVLATACGSPRPAGHPTTSVRVEPAAASPAAELLPELMVADVSSSADGERRIQQLEVVDQDLRLVVRGLAESLGLDYQLDPAVSGRVTTRLRNVTVREALDALVLPYGYAYQIQGNVLQITPARLQTRIFPLDYVSVSRVGVGTTTIQRRLGATGGNNTAGGALGASAGGIGAGGAGGLGGGLGGGTGADVIQSVTVADLWDEIRVALEGLIFDTPGDASAANDAGNAGAAGLAGGARPPGAFSRVGGDGRRLIINPIAGTILVSASPEKLEEVATYLRTIEGSVQRQVLIEAKIVEVTLNRGFQFGIDWSMMQRVGNLDLRLGAGQAGAQFTLEADPDGGVDVVLRALETQGEVSVLSSPRVSVLNNQRAAFNVTTDEVFFAVTRQPVIGPNGGTIGFNTQIQPQQVAVGITLDVLAQIAADNVITMSVRPVITDVIRVDSVRLEDGTQATAPVIDRRETDTVVRVRGGETIVIGGLMQTRRADRASGVPVLRDIPLLGRLFGGSSQTTDKRELVIFITPRIVAGQPQLGR